MKEVYLIAGITKQAYFQHCNRSNEKQIYQEELFLKADAIREVHPKIGVRKMYYMIAQEYLGKNNFETLMLNNGYRVKYPPNFIKTTYSVKCYQYKNLIKGIELTGVNQVWQSDITYFWAYGKFYYLVFIIDVYSRRILGYKASTTLEATANIEAVNMAFKLTKGKRTKELIHHSDRGSQYASNVYTSLLISNECKISMCNAAYENAYAERVNGIIKNEYLNNWGINSFNELEKALNRAVHAYNYGRPHSSLINNLTPIEFENYVLTLCAEKRPKVKLYTEDKIQEVNHE